jgi:hypothetical protein
MVAIVTVAMDSQAKSCLAFSGQQLSQKEKVKKSTYLFV